jgi:hypothetical protein
MVSTGIKSSELSVKHLAKTFYFVFNLFILKSQIKVLADFIIAMTFRLAENPHCV